MDNPENPSKQGESKEKSTFWKLLHRRQFENTFGVRPDHPDAQEKVYQRIESVRVLSETGSHTKMPYGHGGLSKPRSIGEESLSRFVHRVELAERFGFLTNRHKEGQETEPNDN